MASSLNKMRVSRRHLISILMILMAVFVSLIVSTEILHGKQAKEEIQKHRREFPPLSPKQKELVQRKSQASEKRKQAIKPKHSSRLREQRISAFERLMAKNKALANYTRPPLETIIDKYGNVTGDPQFLLDFAIIGFGKCGTSSMMHWLSEHPEIKCFKDEIWELIYFRPQNLIRLLYERLPPGHYKRGYKCPAEITQSHIMDYFRNLFPKTKLMIGIRHPVRWFESLYNFRVQNLPSVNGSMPHPNRLIGRCMKGMRHTCTEKGNYGYNLLRLGKHLEATGPRLSTLTEEALVGKYKRNWFNVSNVPLVPNPIFLFELNQLGDSNATRIQALQKDVQKFLGLQQELPPPIHHKPGVQWRENIQKIKDQKKIDICKEEYKPVRRELMRMARLNAEWIRNAFITSPSVYVSSPDYFDSLLEAWMVDPCGNDTDIIEYDGPKIKAVAIQKKS